MLSRWRAEAAMGWSALQVLAQELGVAESLTLATKLLRRRGRSLAQLPVTRDPRERACRAQVGGALALRAILAEGRDEETASQITQAAMVKAGAAYMRIQVPRLRRLDFEGLAPEAQRQSFVDLVGRFPNVELGAVEIDADRFRFEVTDCRLLELSRIAGAPELAPLFCACDDAFFAAAQPEVEFERPATLAAGGPCCDFRFRWRALEGNVE